MTIDSFVTTMSKMFKSFYKSNKICVCLFLSLTKYIPYSLIDMVLLYSVASHRSWEGF